MDQGYGTGTGVFPDGIPGIAAGDRALNVCRSGGSDDIKFAACTMEPTSDPFSDISFAHHLAEGLVCMQDAIRTTCHGRQHNSERPSNDAGFSIPSSSRNLELKGSYYLPT